MNLRKIGLFINYIFLIIFIYLGSRGIFWFFVPYFVAYIIIFSSEKIVKSIYLAVIILSIPITFFALLVTINMIYASYLLIITIINLIIATIIYIKKRRITNNQ
ncbi:hypothetical protein MNSC_04960 [Minisyncoccus archaeophilus]